MRNRGWLIANGLGFKNKFFSFSPPWHLIYGKPNTTKGVEFKIPARLENLFENEEVSRKI